MCLFFYVEENEILVEYTYPFLRLIFNTAQLSFYHCPLLVYHCTNGQCYPPILGPVFNNHPIIIFLCVCSAWLFTCLSNSCLALSLAPSLEPDFSLFSCFSSSCLSLSLAPSLKPFLLALILFTIHLKDHKYSKFEHRLSKYL